MINLHWISIGTGKLALTHRIGRRDSTRLASLGVQRVVTLLCESEGAPLVGELVQQAGLAWSWLPLRNGDAPRGDADIMLRAALPALSHRLDEGEAILIHCSAGIHRTGMLAFALLRWRGYAESDALDLIGQMRLHTRNGLQSRQIAWGNRVIAESGELGVSQGKS